MESGLGLGFREGRGEVPTGGEIGFLPCPWRGGRGFRRSPSYTGPAGGVLLWVLGLETEGGGERGFPQDGQNLQEEDGMSDLHLLLCSIVAVVARVGQARGPWACRAFGLGLGAGPWGPVTE